MKKRSFSQRYPLVARMCRFWDNLLNWTEIRAARVRKVIRKILKPNKSWHKRSYQPEMEGLELRFMPALHVTSFTASATGYRVQFDQPVDPAPLNIYDASSTYGAADATMFTGNQVEKIAFTGTATGGTFTLAFNGATSAAITYSATASTLQSNVQSALNALTSVGSGNSAVTAVSSTEVQVTFQGLLAMQTMATMTSANSLTPTTASLSVSNVTTPSPVKLAAVPNADNSAFTFIRAGTGSAGFFPGVLTADTYRVVLHSGSNAFKDLGGGSLDGDNNGSTGDDYVNTITVASTPSVILSIPDVARGPDSSHNIRVASDVGNAVQTITFTGATSGTFTLTFNGSTTTPITYSTVASTLKGNIQSALDVLSTIGLGNTDVSSSATAPQVTFQLGLGGATQPNMGVNYGSLTGSSPTASVATTTAGKNTFIPVTLSGAVNVTDVTFDLAYDPDLLNISGTFDSTAGSLTLVSTTNGVASFNFHSGTARSGTVTLGQIISQAPDSSNNSYGASRVLDLSNIVVNSGAISAAADDAVQVVAYLGDVDGDGTYSSTDATLMNNVATAFATGFTAYRLIDPKIIGDLNAGGDVNSSDVTLANRLLGGLQPNQYPPLPPTTHFSVVPSTTNPTSGSAFSVTVTALDQFNHQSFFYGGLVHFTTTDPSTSVSLSLPSDYRFIDTDVGVHTFTNGVTLITAGGQTVTVTDTSSSGVTGTSNPIYPLGVTNGYVRTADPVQSARVPVGNALVLPGTGSVIVSDMLDLDRSPSTPTLGGEPALIFNSGTVNVFPIVEAVYTSDPNAAVPSQIEARLKWSTGSYSGWTTFSISGHGTYVVALQGPSVTATDYYLFDIDVKVTVSGTPTTYTYSGGAAIVVEDSSDPYGQGWSLAGVDHLVTTTSGAILVDGETGSGRYFSLSGGVYTSPNDFGHLVHSGNTYTYETEHLLTYSFDSNGNLAKIADPHGLTRTFVYDGNGLLTLINDPDGSTATLTYDGSHKLSQIDAPGSRTVGVTVNGSGNLTKIVNPDGGTRTFTYDGSHRLTDDHLAPLGTFSYGYSSGNGTLSTVTLDATSSYTLSAGNTQALATSPAKNLSAAAGKLTDPLSHVYTYTLDAQDRLTKLETPDGGTGLLTETWNRNLAGLPIGHTDPLGRLTNYGYDGSGDMTGVFYPDHTQQTTAYDATYHLPTSMTDQRGNVSQYLYDSAGSMTAVVDPLNQTTSFLRDSAGNATAMVDALGNRTSYLFDATNVATVVIDPLQKRTSYLLDAAGNATVVIDALNNRVTTTFDAMRRVTSVTQFTGYSEIADPGLITSTTAFDYAGHVTDETDPVSRITHYAYDAQGRLSSTTRAYGTGLAATTATLFDAAGNVTQVTDPIGKITQYQYDTLNRATVTIDPLTFRMTTAYDAANNVTQVTDARGQATQYLYDSLNRTTATTDPLGQRTRMFFDAAGNMTGLKDAKNLLTQYVFDPLNRQTVTVDPLGKRTTQLLDKVGNVTGIRDANNNLATFQYDAANRRIGEFSHLGLQTTNLYDALGQLTEIIDPAGRHREFAYDGLGRLTMTTDGVGNHAYTNYYHDGRINQQSSFGGDGNVQNFYDALGHATVIVDAEGGRTTIVYDLADHVTQVNDPNNHPTYYLIDDAGRITVTTDALSQATTMMRDGAGNITVVIDPLNRRTTYLLDALGRASVVIDALSGRTTTLYDKVGHVIQVTDPNNHATQFVYDDAGRLLTSVDALGGRTSTLFDAQGNATGMQDQLGHLTQYLLDGDYRVTVTIDPMGGRTTMLYDKAGNVTEMFDANNNPTQYLFDGNNRVSVTIDALGNRTTMLFDVVGNMTEIIDANSHTNTFTFDDNRRQIASYDGFNNETLTFYDKAGNVTGVLDANSHGTSYIYDELNRQTAVRDALGNRTTFGYDAVGNRTSLTDALLHTTTYDFDALNRMTGMTDPLSNHTTYLVDAAGNVTAVEDARYNRTSFLFDALNRQTVTIDALTNRTTLLFDLAGNMTGQQDALNRLTTSLYDLNNRLTVTVDALTNRTTLTLDAMGNRIAVTDALSHTTSYVYDALNRQSAVIDAQGNWTSTLYDSVGNVTAVVQYRSTEVLHTPPQLNLSGASGSPKSVDQNPYGMAVGDFNEDGKDDLVTLNADDNCITIFLSNGNGTFTTGDTYGLIVGFVEGNDENDPITFSPSGITVGDFNENGHLDLAVVGGTYLGIILGNGDGTFLPEETLIESSEDPLAIRFPYHVDSDVKQVAATDFDHDGHTDLAYTRSGYVSILLGNGDGTFGHGLNDDDGIPYGNTTGDYAAQSGTNAIAIGDFDEDGDDDVAAVNEGSDTVSIFLGDGLGDLGTATNISVGSSPGQVALGDFNGDDHRDFAVPNDDGSVVIKLGNGDGTFQSAIYADSGSSPWPLASAYVSNTGQTFLVVVNSLSSGNVRVLRPTGDGTFPHADDYGAGSYPAGIAIGDFNDDGVPDVAVSNPGDPTLSIFLGSTAPDFDTNVVHTSVTQYQYDANNRPTTATDPLNHSNYQYYDKVGNVTGVKDPNNNLTSFAFDAVDRITSQSQTLNGTLRTTTFAYDSVGSLTSTTDALGRKRNFEFDALNRLTTETWYNNGSTSPAQIFTSMYDAVGNLTVAANAAGTYTMSYDALNRVTVTQEPFNQRLTFSYDAVGNRTEVRDSQNGGITTSLYDGLNRLTSLQFSGTTGPSMRVDSTYTNTSMLESLTRYSSLAALTTTTVAVTSFLYDVTDRVTAILHNKANGDSLISMQYDYDPMSRLTAETINGAERDFTYDDSSQLTADSTSTFTYDDGGNRNNGSYATVSGNLMSNDGVWTYTYDAAGNLTKKSKGSSAETWTYGYDQRNQLILVEKHSTDGGAVTLRDEFKYDYFNRRIEKDYDSNGDTTGGLTVTKFAYDGDEVWADLDGSGSLTTRYIRGDAVDEVFARIAADGTAAWVLTDHLGSELGWTDSSGTLRVTMAYDGWGNMSSTSLTGSPMPVGRYGWTGREIEVETELQYNRARYYDPKAGRWITQDPLGFDAGDSNLYRYVNNGPTNATDPSGLLGHYIIPKDTELGAGRQWFSKMDGRVIRDGLLEPASPLTLADNKANNWNGKKAITDVKAGGDWSPTGVRLKTSAGGDLEVYSWGSFYYKPPPGFQGIDRFSYKGANGVGLAGRGGDNVEIEVGDVTHGSPSIAEQNGKVVVIVLGLPESRPANKAKGTFLDAKIPIFHRKQTTGEEDIDAIMKGIAKGLDVVEDTVIRMAHTVYHVGDAIFGDIIRAIPAGYEAAKDVISSKSFQEAFIKTMQYELAAMAGAADKLQTMTGVSAFQQWAGGHTVTAKGELVQLGLVTPEIATRGGQIGAGAFDVLMIVLPLGAKGVPRPANPSQYSSVFETRLNIADWGTSHATHVRRAEAALAEYLSTADEWYIAMYRGGQWRWHHATIQQGGGRAGVMQLVPYEQHMAGSPWQAALHPGGTGGYPMWAVPMGATPRR